MTEEGIFTIPVNLGPAINTPMDETAPFIHADGKTLYFASDGHPGLGGKDLFYSTLLKDGNWSEPTNLGYPINTYADEINILISASGTTAYFSSDIDGGYGGLDLYYFTLDERLRPTPVTYLKGTVKDAASKQPLEAHIEMIDLETNQVITATQSDPKTGEFLACILTGTNVMLNVSHPYYPFYSENFQLKKDYTELKPYLKDIELHKPDVGNTFILRNIFFDFDKSELKPESFVELNSLVFYLKENNLLKIEIGGHTDNQGSAEYNQNLSLARARSVYSYLISKGIESSRLSYAGYGMSVPITDNNSEEGRASNRRTEFKVVE
jgi:outer membrane protein OmpA-like peptidoglycan-associated protein